MAPGLFTAGLCRVRNKSFAASVFRGLIPINSGLRTRSNSTPAFWSSSSSSWYSKTICDSLQAPYTCWFRLLFFVRIQSWCWRSFHSQTALLHDPVATKDFMHTWKQSGADLFSAPAWGLRERTHRPLPPRHTHSLSGFLVMTLSPSPSALHCISEMLHRETCPKGVS